MLIAALRQLEFARLDDADHAYLDYTGAAPYPASLVEAHADMLRSAILGNPHSESGASLASSALLAEARCVVRRFFRADDYEVCFTQNASGAIRLVAESFPFTQRSTLLLSTDNHNSVNGVREFARRAGARVRYLPLDDQMQLDARALGAGPGLLAFPAQSNFSGAKHNLGLVRRAQDAGYSVLLDAAAYAPTSTLDLTAISPDFVAVSFYKMFGYPSGVGALLVKRSALTLLQRPWFAGGTVEHVTVGGMSHRLREGAEGFEDGTVNFLSMGAISAGIRWLWTLDVDRVGQHACGLATRLANGLRSLRHRSGGEMVRMYGPDDARARGAVVTFNVLDERADIVPHAVVETFARDLRVSVRGGCFCNPGAAEAVGLGLGARAEGAVRASLGVASNARDVDRLLEVVFGVATGRRRRGARTPGATPVLASSGAAG